MQDLQKLKTTNDAAIYSFTREDGTKKVLVLLNLTSKPQSFNIINASIAGKPMNIFSGKSDELKDNQKFDLAPWGYLVYSY